jgi:arsenate reductase
MAQGILQSIMGDTIEVLSAGTKPAGYVHPMAVQVMKEIDIDISDHKSRHLDEYLDRHIDAVVTVCGEANENCPVFPGNVKRYHWGFADPAKATGTEQERLAQFRKVRDQIRIVMDTCTIGRLERGEIEGALSAP